MSKLKTLLLSSAATIILLIALTAVAYAFTGTGTVNVTSGYLNLRQSPSTDSQILGKLYPGTQVSIVDSTDGWYKINYSNQTGWVSSAYITVKSTDPGSQTSGASGIIDQDDNYDRIQGTDRYATAVAISRDGWQSSSNVVIATGEEYPDALCAAPLAKMLDAPILLTSQDHMDAEVINEIKRLGAAKAYIIGGQGAVSSSVEDTLKSMGLTIDRTYGSDRYETSAQVAEKYFKKVNEVVIATGGNYPDAISFAPIAAAKGIPILLTPGDDVSQSIKDYIKSSGVSCVYIAGGEGVVSKNVEDEFPYAVRLAGKDRYETNTVILNYFAYMLNMKNVYAATGEDYPDALTGSVLSAKSLSPIILTGKKPEQVSLDFSRQFNVTSNYVHVLGGAGAVLTSALKVLFPDPPQSSVPLSQYVKGIDVSRYQGDIDWNAVKNAGYTFAIVKITGSNSNGLYTDAKALENVQEAKDAGLIVGGYHYAYFQDVDGAVREANYFKSVAANLGLSYVALDIEYKGVTGDMTSAALAFLDTVSDIAQPVLYSSPSYIRAHFNNGIIKYPLWIANYGVTSPSVPIWSNWMIWQEGSDGVVPGISVNVDLDYMKPDFLIKKN